MITKGIYEIDGFKVNVSDYDQNYVLVTCEVLPGFTHKIPISTSEAEFHSLLKEKLSKKALEMIREKFRIPGVLYADDYVRRKFTAPLKGGKNADIVHLLRNPTGRKK